jgi:hypothetical protein
MEKTTITKDMFDLPIEEFVLYKQTSFKATGDSNESKTVNLEIRFKGATVNTLAQSCLSQGVVVKWQNGRARKDYDKIVDRSTVKIDWSSPATAPQVDPVTAMIQMAAAAGMSVEEYLKAELAKRS